MIAHKKQFSASVRLMLLGVPLLLLAACHSAFGPHEMPAGYKHHGKASNSIPGPEPVWKKVEHIAAFNPDKKKAGPCLKCADGSAAVPAAEMTVITDLPVDSSWNMAAHDLLTRMVDGFGQPNEPVYIRLPAPGSETEHMLAQALRNAMNQRGFNVAPAPGIGPFTLHYAASALGVGDGDRMMVTLTLAGTAGMLTEVSGIYALSRAAPVEAAAPVMMPEKAAMEDNGAPLSLTPAAYNN